MNDVNEDTLQRAIEQAMDDLESQSDGSMPVSQEDLDRRVNELLSHQETLEWFELPWPCGHADPVYINSMVQRCHVCGMSRRDDGTNDGQ